MQLVDITDFNGAIQTEWRLPWRSKVGSKLIPSVNADAYAATNVWCEWNLSSKRAIDKEYYFPA